MAIEKIPVKQLRMGDVIVVEPSNGAKFDAVYETHLGWALTHGNVNLGMRRVEVDPGDDGDGRFSYEIGIETLVEVR